MIVSRGAEVARLDGLVGRLRAGDGRALLVRGGPGIGKTTLLDALVERCGDDVRVLRARGVETEAELAFAALADLLGPIADHLSALPAPQSAALAAALAVGPPAPGDPLGVCVATLGLLRAAAERPLVAVVDDLHWIDAASRDCILYAARRAGGRVAFVLAARDTWDGLERQPLPELRLEPLDRDASLAVLRRTVPNLAPSVAETLADAAAGNPLALVELPATLTAAQRTAVEPVELPLAPGTHLHATFARRIERLDPLARRALLVAATHAGDEPAVVAAACTEAGTSFERLVPAEERGLVRLEPGRVRFSHPLVRGAAYHAADPGERRHAHRALARVLDGERRAWHLASAAVGPDEPVAATLEQAAGAAAARRGFASASVALERAARLSPEATAFARRLLAAGESAGAAGEPHRAIALLREGSNATTDEALRARAQYLRGLMLIWSGSVEAGTTLLEGEAGRAARHDPVLAAEMLAGAANGSTAVNAYHRAAALAERAGALLGDGGGAVQRVNVLATQAWVLVLHGAGARRRASTRSARIGRRCTSCSGRRSRSTCWRAPATRASHCASAPARRARSPRWAAR